jgi:class 3 adenylate cyclase
MTANAAADFLNRHFTMVADCVEAEGGVVDKYMGDSVMAFWGAPDRVPDQADRACRTALAVAAGVRAFNRAQAAGGGPQIRMRIGIHLGRVVVGNIGSPGRINYTVVGDPVVVAQRLEEAGKQLADEARDVVVLISGAVRAALMSDYRLSPLGRHRLRGRSDEIEVFAIEPAPQTTSETASEAAPADAREEHPG